MKASEVIKRFQLWQIRDKGGRLRLKIVGTVDKRWCYQGKRPKRRLHVSWYRSNKGRYSGIWADRLIAEGKLIQEKVEDPLDFLYQLRRYGKPPVRG